MPTPWFFERLGIPSTKDVKLIKRAYAVALKNIDQQDEREAFETLRMAYEQALAWVAEPEDDEFPDAEWEDGESDAGERDDDEPLAFIDARDAGQPPFIPPGPDRNAYGPPPQPNDPAAAPAPPEPGPAPYRVAHPPQPPQQRDSEREDLAARHTAMRDWLARLLDTQQSTVDVLLDDALKDPLLGHLDSQSQLEAYIADALYNDPAAHISLFHAASRRFGWTDRNARSGGSTATANWITRVVNQELQWRDQPAIAIAAQNAALQAALQTSTPGNRLTHQFAPVLDGVHEKFPDWLTLSLPPGRLRAWQQAYAALSPAWLRMARFRDYYLGDRRKMPGRIIVAVLLLLMVQGFARAMINGTLFSSDTPASTQTQVPAPAAPATEPVLAYEFTGAVTKDSCDSAHEFIHESNWLEISDPAAIALLTTRVLLCQQFKQWPQADDPLVSCLRDERLAALTAGRPEDNTSCMAQTSAKK